MSVNSIRNTFFEECDELLETMSDGLSDMETGKQSDDTIHSVFRSVHSIKGGAGAFAMHKVVAFAHRFETLMDHARDGRLAADATLIGIFHRAADHLAQLIEDERQDNDDPRDETAKLLATLDQYLGASTDEAAPDAPFEFVPISFDAEPIELDLPQLGNDNAGATGFHIVFTPKQELFANGHEPILLFSALREMGELTITADPLAVPKLPEMEWNHAYLTWHMDLVTIEPEQNIHEVFEFVDGLCDLEISILDNPAPTHLAVAPALEAIAPDDAPPRPDTTTNMPAEPADKSIAAKQSNTKPTGPKATLRVDLDRVDRLINTVGELIINQAMIAQRIADANLPPAHDLQSELDAYQSLARDIQEGVMAIRAQPVKPLFQRMSRIVREAIDATGKKVKLVTEGETTEVDKTVIERIADPLTHMVRNAVDHGIETPGARTESGKDATGTIYLSASHRSGRVVIKIRDDGAGLNRPRILQTAVQKGLVTDTADLTDGEIDNLLFMPGFSTASEVSNLSGRGVGMDVVKNSISKLGGRVAISSQTGQGSTFSISLPLTLAVLDGMVVHVAGQVMIIPLSSILETVRPRQSDLHAFGVSRWMLRIRDQHVPIYDVGLQLALRNDPVDYTEKVLLLVESEERGRIVLAVDDISDQRQVVIKGMQANYGAIPGISAATILGDGKIALILDPETLTTDIKQTPPTPTPPEMQHAASA